AAAPTAISHRALGGAPATRCAQIADVARLAERSVARRGSLLAASSPELVSIALASASHPARWGYQRAGLVMSRPGRLLADFELPRAGAWELWLRGQIMPAIGVRVDGRLLGSAAGHLAAH